MVSERPARRGENEGVDRLRSATFEALEDRRMLAVDGKQEPSTPLPGREREVAGRDEALLVRERERDTVLERPQGGAYSGEARRPRSARDRAPRLPGSWSGHRRLGCVEPHGGLRDPPAAASRSECDDLEVRVGIDDLQRLPTDRTGGPEQRDPSDVGGHRGRLTGVVFRRRYARAIERSLHRYGDDASQVGELFSPDGGGPHPVIVVIHGGYWKARWDRSLMTGLCEDLADQGSRRLEPGVPTCGERRWVAGDVRRRRLQESICCPSSRSHSISDELARSDIAQAATLRSGRQHGRRSRATPPAPRRASSRAPSSPRPVWPTFAWPQSPRLRTSPHSR